MIKVFKYSEAGGPAENEDALEIRLLAENPECYLCAVADGQGGHAGGAKAARVACRATLDAALGYTPVELLRPGTWVRILQLADEAVSEDDAAGFTTLVAFCLTNSCLCGSSSGDSAAVLANASRPSEILTARQQKNPPVGSGGAMFASFTAKLICPWNLLAMTDGVWKYAGWKQVVKIASERRDQEIIDSLRDCARLPGSGGLQDDFTLVVFRSDAT